MTYSIITCTYNPNPKIFNRLITAVDHLKSEKCKIEWIIVDNNSTTPIKNAFDFSKLTIPVSHIIEKTPGLTKARIAGSIQAKNQWLVFLDDDNEPAPTYITELNHGIQQYPQVSCWGPGHIEVEYIGKVEKWYYEHKSFFQQQFKKTKFGQERYMQEYYPIGTGLCIQKKAMIDYIAKVEAGLYNISDRTGRSLVSGGDTQIVLNNQLNGGIAGKLEKLALTHMIEARKANFKYLRKQKFWTAASYHLVLSQVYSDKVKYISPNNKFRIKDLILLFRKFYHEIKVKKRDFRSAFLNTCGFLGEYYAPYFAWNKKPNNLFTIIQKILIR